MSWSGICAVGPVCCHLESLEGSERDLNAGHQGHRAAISSLLRTCWAKSAQHSSPWCNVSRVCRERNEGSWRSDLPGKYSGAIRGSFEYIMLA